MAVCWPVAWMDAQHRLREIMPLCALLPGAAQGACPGYCRLRSGSPGKAFTPRPGNNLISSRLTHQLLEQSKSIFHAILADHKSAQLVLGVNAFRDQAVFGGNDIPRQILAPGIARQVQR